MDYLERSNKLFEKDGQAIDAFVISSEANMRYFSGFTGDSGALLVAEGKRWLVTDFRYREQAIEQAPDYEYVEFSADSPLWATLGKHIKDLGASCLGFEDESMVFDTHEEMTEKIPGQWKKASSILAGLRAVKDEEEQACMREAARIADRAFTHIMGFIVPGMTELDIALELEYFMRKEGASGNSFDPIVASGPNGSRPHAIPGIREIRPGDMVTMDFGCVFEGYCSDMTRTVGIGKLADEQISVYNIVLEAQTAATEAAKSGMRGNEVDAIAREIIASYGYGDHFGHGLGHSLGIEVHEEPRFSPSCDRVIEANTIMTIEPGIYLDGRFGVRIEDFGLVTESGFESFTRSPKELIYI